MKENSELNINEVVRVETLPVIFQQLEIVGKYIDEELDKVKDLKATEDNKQEVKKVRTSINNTIKAFETKRKEIKQECLKAYEEFNTKYEQEVKSKLDNASEQLKQQIDNIETEQIYQKNIEVVDFINEHIKANNLISVLTSAKVIDIAGLKINLSTSLKSLKEQALAFIERVSNDIKLIDMEENYKEEILYEYQRNEFDYANSKLYVLERHKKIEELTPKMEEIEQAFEEENKLVEKVMEITTPKEIIEDEQILECTFTIRTTKEKLKRLKQYLDSEEIDYE